MKGIGIERPIRILRVIARLNIGGPAIQAISLSEELSGNEYETLLVCGKVGSNEGDMTYLAKAVCPYVLPELGREISPAADLYAVKSVRRIIRQFRPDIIHTHTAKAGTIGRLAAISLNMFRGPGKRIRLVHTFHGHVFHSYFHPLKTALFIHIERFLARFTDRIIVISSGQKRDICEKFGIAAEDRTRIIPLGFDLSPFKESVGSRVFLSEQSRSLHSNAQLVVGIVGRLTQVKNHRMLLEAVRLLKDAGRGHRFSFRVIGDGELRGPLEEYARELDVGGSVRFMGWQRDMAALYSEIDIVVLTSFNEGTPVALIEAMAAGKPIVATDVGGVGDLLGEVEEERKEGFLLAKRGILIPSGREDVLANALLFFSENSADARQMTDQARTWVMGHHSRERLLKDMDALYRELMANTTR